MKKNQPSSSAQPSVKELRQRFEQAIVRSSPPEALSTRIPPQKPPRTKKNTRIVTEGEVVYASLDFSNTPPHINKNAVRGKGNETIYATIAPQKNTEEAAYASVTIKNLAQSLTKKRNTEGKKQEETLHTMVASKRTTRILSEKEIANIIPHNPLVKAYAEEVQHWSQIVYGNAHALQKKTEELLKNPTLGDDLSWQLAAHPESLHKLAGVSMCGFKSGARKRAEKNFIFLYSAVDCYVESLKCARESLLQSPDAELKRYKQSMGSEAMSKILQTSHYPERKRDSLSTEEVFGRVQSHPAVQRYGAQVAYWCTVVFGNSTVLQERMADILKNPTLGNDLSWQVAAHPISFHKLAGMKMCGLKNSTRRQAENGLQHLCSAIENYGEAVKQVKESIVQNDQKKQNREEQPAELAQQLQKQQALSNFHQQHVQTAVKTHQETATASRQEAQRKPEVPPRKVGGVKAMAFC
ncbi:BID domain-containing T4SS effector [Candidatus Bartonella washoeensis]|uniref:Bartonella effector protein BID domain-containing protein n=1 Tax=Cardidatus Bartonella washoeensis 085-0475 TaxID=1094564 RepID=J0QMC4_9HYPH|nr:BID domain-containing T4SS effector [Bartonella washoeensis]EJF86806.1 hypothetical protein MCW_00029 [Bartonella washoeensis 085-0475]